MKDNPSSRNISALQRSMPGESLPRERALSVGVKSLTDIELIAILLGSGIRGKNVIELSTEILSYVDGHLSDLAKTPVEELLTRHSGLGRARTITLLAAIELGIRAAADAEKVSAGRKPLTDPATIVRYMKRHFQNINHEEFWVIMLTRNLKLIREFRVSSGGLTATVVDPKLIIRPMLGANATAAILFHNHPSGNLKPSVDDISLTDKIKRAAELFDIKILDHIIISDEGYYSLKENGDF